MESFFGTIGFLFSLICFSVGLFVVCHGAFEGIRAVQAQLLGSINRVESVEAPSHKC